MDRDKSGDTCEEKLGTATACVGVDAVEIAPKWEFGAEMESAGEFKGTADCVNGKYGA